MVNPNIAMTLDDAVQEVLGFLEGLDLAHVPHLDQYYAVTRQINRALRTNATEVEWSYYSGVETIGTARCGDREILIPSNLRPRIEGDDSVRFIDDCGIEVQWAYILPRDSLHKYTHRHDGIWAAVTRDVVAFSRPFTSKEEGLRLQLPVMREPEMFELPKRPLDPNAPIPEVPESVREQLVDFSNPDLITMKAAFLIAQSNPVYQPRVQTLDDQYKDMMYQLKERDEKVTESPYMNEFIVPITPDLFGNPPPHTHLHPHSDARWR